MQTRSTSPSPIDACPGAVDARGFAVRNLTAAFIAFTALTAGSAASAASLQVAPVLLDVVSTGDAATSITLRNSGTRPINAQVRVFRWTQVNGADAYEETDDVAVSPPFLTLRPDADFTVRVVRKSGTPIHGEESYRLIADELPDPENRSGGTINLVVRHSVPVFFRSPDTSNPSVTWSVSAATGKLETDAVNDGDRRLRVAALKVTDAGGSVVNYGEGLIGYVLGHSSAVFISKTSVRGFTGGKAQITAQGDIGPINATAPITLRK